MIIVNVFVHINKCAGGTVQNHIENQFSYDERFGPHNLYYKEKISQTLGIFDDKKWIHDSAIVKKSEVHKYLANLSVSQKNTIACVYGHAAYYGIHIPLGREARYFTFLREPLARFVSYYNYIRAIRVTSERLIRNEIQKRDGTLRSLDDWLAEANLNSYSMASFLLHSYQSENLLQDFPIPTEIDMYQIKKMLASFYFVGLTEQKEDMDFTLGSLGIKTFLQDTNVLQKKDTYMTPHDMKTARKIVEKRCPMDVELYEYAKKLNLEKKEQIPNYKEMVSQIRAQRELQIKNKENG